MFFLKIEDAFGQALKAARTSAGLSQVDFATRCGCNVMSISKLERGLTQPSLHFMILLSKGLGIDAIQLLEATQAYNPTVHLPKTPLC